MVISTVITLSCSICRDDDNGTNMSVTKCGHAFHSACLRTWEETQRQHGGTRKCPYCAAPSSSYYGYHDSYSSSETPNAIRLHSLSLQRVLIIEEGQPSPEDELITVRKNLDSAKVLLNKESNKVHQLEIELSKLRRDQGDLEATVTKLKTESKKQTLKISNLLTELKTEKQNRQKALAVHLGEKERLRKRIDDGSSYIDKLKAERLEINRNLHALRVDNTNIRALSDSLGQVVKQLNLHIFEMTLEKNSFRAMVNAMKGDTSYLLSHMHIQSNNSLLDEFHGGFQRLETEYLALKGLFDEKLAQTTYAQSQMDPALLQPNESESFNPESRNAEFLDSINSLPSLPGEVGLCHGKPGKKKGKHRFPLNESTKEKKNSNNPVDGKSSSNPAVTKSLSENKSQSKYFADNQDPSITTSDNNLASYNNLASDNFMKEQDPIILASNQQIPSASSKDKVNQVY